MKVVFRKFKDDAIIALFPDEIADTTGGIMSYMRVGQHGAASPDLIEELAYATPNEYEALLSELSNHVGYTDLIVG